MGRWRPVTGEEAARLERELHREVPVGHPLHGQTVRAVAACDHSDDVAFTVEGTGLCIVHLTWRVETDPKWPWTTFVDALSDDDDA